MSKSPMPISEGERQARAARAARFSTMPGAPVAGPSILSSSEISAGASASTAGLEGIDGPPPVKDGKRKAVEDGQETRLEKRAKLEYRSDLERRLIRARARAELAREEERRFRDMAEKKEEEARQIELRLRTHPS